MNSVKKANLLAAALLLVGSTQMIGYLAEIPALRGVGAASAMSPCPKVFGTAPVHGTEGMELETYSAEFCVLYRLGGDEQTMKISPEIYSRVAGPYNRRNVYGAALAYGPCLPPELSRTLLNHALSDPGLLRSEIGIPEEASDLRIRIRGKSALGQSHEWILSQ